MNILIDPETGAPRWNASAQQLGPKEDFALETALRLQAGRLSLEQLKEQIVEAANLEWSRVGKVGVLRTLNDVKDNVGKSGKDWYFEIQRVAEFPDLLQQLINQDGRGLTALSRRAGPVQPQRRKGNSDKASASEIFDLISILEETRRAILFRKATPRSILDECKRDILKYRLLLKDFLQI